MFGDPRLSAAAKLFIDQAGGAGQKVVLSAISLAEILYLVEKGRLPSSAYDKLRQSSPLTGGIVEAIKQVPRADVPDRIVAATGIYFGVPVISVAAGAKPTDNQLREILVSEQSHLRGDRISLVFVGQIAGVGRTGENVISQFQY